jgi:hypothetical protein
MRCGAPFAGLLAVASSLNACDREPAQPMIERTQAAVRGQLLVPQSGRFFDVKAYVARDLVCGRIRTSGRTGYRGYAGIDGFAYQRGELWFGSAGQMQFRPHSRDCMDAEMETAPRAAYRPTGPSVGPQRVARSA